MTRQTAEAVEAARIEGDRQAFVSSLADATREITCLMHKYEDYDKWEGEDEGDEGDELSKWYKDDTVDFEVAGVGGLDYGKRVRGAAAPLNGPWSGPNAPGSSADVREPPGLISAAKKAARAAAIAALDTTHNTKASEKLSVPSYPKIGEMTN